MKITIAGAGAMGSRFGVMLHQAGNQVVLVDGWPDHVAAIQEKGLTVIGPEEERTYPIPAYLQKQLDPTLSSDLIILFTKALGLEAMLQDIAPSIKADTKVLCLLNGLGHEEVIKKYVPAENIYLGNTMWTAGMEGPGRVKLFGDGSVTFTNLVPGHEEDAKELADLMSQAGLRASYSDQILHALYKKACVNGTLNGLCTLLECNMADFGETGPAHDIVTAIVSEFSAVAKCEGVDLSVEETVHFIETNTYNRSTIGLHFPSMHQDLIQHNRLTEIDCINGAIVQKGLKYGIPTPYCSFLTQLIHAKEQLRGAK